MKQIYTNFGSLNFGKANAEWELEDNPDLLREGFLDPFDIKQDILRLKKWIVVGPKGAGKTSILTNLQFDAQVNPELFVKAMDLDDFPLDALFDVDTGESTGALRAQDMWTYLLLVEMFASFQTDEGAASNRESEIRDIYTNLIRGGLLPARKLKESFMRLKEVDLRAGTPGFEAGIKLENSKNDASFRTVMNHLLYHASRFRTNSTHLIFVDGLDSVAIGLNDGKRWTVLTALVNAAHRLNIRLRDNMVPVRAVILCRSDIYHELSDPAADKKQANVATFNWLPDNRIPQDNSLVDLAERKCAVGANPRIPLLVRNFSNTIRYQNRVYETANFLMRYTRYLPRDYLTLLNSIAKHSKNQEVVSSNSIVAGLNHYCSDYFVNEAWRGIYAVLPVEEARSMLTLLKSIRGNRFSLQTLLHKVDIDDEMEEFDLRRSLHALYRLGLVSNIDRDDFGTSYLNYAYHSQFGRLDFESNMVLHDALTIGLRKPFREVG
ncbi:hypothetical protein E4P29_16830 [Rhodococcus sp. 1R11]|uniref:P-loop ATPase, Sll1717 family n=1 Tax=Rhodococcus sp. 1R11 TaxID=2559614 RepID=UPI001071EE38|nr:hypothetical protein [Rhodococcus sp. 1R11]TFI42212.1 hypothetical protein E4P29_16830 [Rhodococcus sp. 1R11]